MVLLIAVNTLPLGNLSEQWQPHTSAGYGLWGWRASETLANCSGQLGARSLCSIKHSKYRFPAREDLDSSECLIK